jgi:hypothetical protein
MARRDQPKGPKPILHVGGRRVEDASGTAPSPVTGPTIIGRPGPNDRQYVLDRDECGPVISYVPGTGPP